ncbi:TetR/AcrR family transcriptional regulator [Halosolutus gelatinilyticus]|uniref:TetR/AcrR family transcriptional regulator n=1 Tax=Halosolutus gelatinilyticus TaxID=2931975 RepID=UPI001FF2138F|nr:TetR/AcrR family transcriptional regulator [Halosolutus gelatinilyticus]
MRGFSDEERDEIRDELVETARRLFEVHGFQKTTVEDVTEPVGIAESTFYRFFDTKSELYTEVLIRENEQLMDAIEGEVATANDPEEKLRRFLQTWAREFEERPLLIQTHQNPQETYLHIDESMFESAVDRFFDRFLPIMEDIQAQTDGFISNADPGTIVEVLGVIELIIAQRELYEEWGNTDYSEFQSALQTVLVRGLLAEP